MIIKKFSDVLNEADFNPFAHLDDFDEVSVQDEKEYLKFGDDNVKLKKLDIIYFSLPAGYTCPYAGNCKTVTHKDGAKFSNDKNIKASGDMYCYASRQESRLPGTRNLRWYNFKLLNAIKNDVEAMSNLIVDSLKMYEFEKRSIRIMRIHESGDFFSQNYFDAWLNAARKRPDILFYCYTKSIPFVVKRKGEIPRNFRIIGSVDGKADKLLMDNPWIRKAFMLGSEEEAIERGLPIDINEYLAIGSDSDFAILIHGMHPAGSPNNKKSDNNKDVLAKYDNITPNKSIIRNIIKRYTT